MIKIAFNDQWNKIKENWFIIILAIFMFIFINGLVLLMMSGGSGTYSSYSTTQDFESTMEKGLPTFSRISADSAVGSQNNVATPETANRLITKSASLNTEVEKDTFNEADSKLRSIVQSSDAFLLNENINKQESSWKSYYTGYYSIKVESSKYNSMVRLLKEIGEVKYFNENALDITEQYQNLQIELNVEKERLNRYLKLYNETKDVKDKIDLNDRIFNQERLIKYYEDQIENQDKLVQYSTISVSITEKQSEFANIIFVKLSDIAETFVSSFNSVIYIIVFLAPWILVIMLIKFGYNKYSNKTEMMPKKK